MNIAVSRVTAGKAGHGVSLVKAHLSSNCCFHYAEIIFFEMILPQKLWINAWTYIICKQIALMSSIFRIMGLRSWTPNIRKSRKKLPFFSNLIFYNWFNARTKRLLCVINLWAYSYPKLLLFFKNYKKYKKKKGDPKLGLI